MLPNPRCLPGAGRHDDKNQTGCLAFPTTLRGVSVGPDAARRQVIQITAGFARTRRKRLIPPGFPDVLMCPGFPGVGLPDSGHATGWIWLARSSSSIGVNMPSDEGQPHRLRRDRFRRARRRGRRPRPRCGRPGACPRARPAGSIATPGRLAITTAARAGSPLTTSQHHHDSRAAPAVTARHRENPGRPIASATGSRAGPGTRPGPGARPAALAGRTGKIPAAGQSASNTVPPPRVP
jgi:hypothetical protein